MTGVAIANTYQGDNHDTDTYDGDYEKTNKTGGYDGNVDWSYDMTGQVEYNGEIINVRITLETGSEHMNLHDLAAWDPRNDISSLYTFGDMGPNAALWAKLAADTGIGTASDWGNGNIKILGPGLQASINLNVHLTGQAMIGDYLVSDGVLNLSYPPASSDLLAILSGNALKSLDGTTMIGKTTLKVLAGKQDTVEFLQLLKQLKDAGIDVEKLLEELEEPEEPEVPEPVPVPHDIISDRITVTFDPPNQDWTNNPYYVYARVSGLENHDDIAPVTVVNCSGHCRDITCPEMVCPGHNWHDEDTYDPNTGEKTGTHRVAEYYCEDGCQKCGGCTHGNPRGIVTASHHGHTTVCYAWAHNCFVDNAKWYWELGVDVLDSNGNCAGSIEGTVKLDGGATLRWRVGILGVWSAEAYFKCWPVQTREGAGVVNYIDWPMPTKGYKGDAWTATKPKPAETTRTSSPYKYDDRMPVLTISTGAYGLGGTYTGNASVDAKSYFGGDRSKYWTNKNINFNVSLTDEHSGPDMGASYIEINGKKLHSVDNYGPCNDHKSMGSFTLTQSGEYKIHFHCEDRAKLGTTSAEDHVPNMFDVYYYVYIDKIPPVVRYGFDDEKVLYNSKRERWETTGEIYPDRTDPYWWLQSTDKESDTCSGYAASGLREAWAYTTQDKNALNNPKTYAMKGHKFATSDMAKSQWKYEMLSEEAIKKGYDVYLIIYAVDYVGNESFTTSYLAKKTDYVDGGTPEHKAPKNHQHAEDSLQRRLPTSMIFIDRAKIITEEDNERGPLEITRVFDVNWEGAITWDKTAKSNTFAVYRNTINDMIGLGYRVNFRYHLIGFGIDKGDKCTLGFELYGHKGDTFQKLDVYTQNPDGNTYSKVAAGSEYYRRTYENTQDALVET
ncbi:MAG: hypothetical protein MJ246_00435 [Clostridia bacterium]|nr:hypothetical protein [Clostridia bacterium]